MYCDNENDLEFEIPAVPLENSDKDHSFIFNSTTTTEDEVDENFIMLGKQRNRLLLEKFEHITLEVQNLKRSLIFYCNFLGFEIEARPPFPDAGHWLFGHGMSLHLILTKLNTIEQKELRSSKCNHVLSTLPCVDHMAFTTTNIEHVIEILNQENVFHKIFELKDQDQYFRQVFIFDPDSNVIEINNCRKLAQNT